MVSNTLDSVSNASGNTSITANPKPSPFSIASPLTDRFRTLFRSIGLAVVTFRRRPESPKVLVNCSRKLAFARSAVHILPSAVSITLSALNIMGYFIGGQLQGVPGQDEFKMGLLQIAAKLQEMLIVGSLTTVVMHFLRSELLFGNGLPLGLIVSGWEFTSIGYFWSADFWGGAMSDETQKKNRRRHLLFVLMIVVCGFIALCAGPATAILMIPRRLDFPVGGGVFWLNGSEEQLWPTYLDAAYYADWDCSTDEQRLRDPKCPSAGSISLYGHYSTWWNSLSAQFVMEVQDSSLKRKEIVIYPAGGDDEDTWTMTSHAASVTMLDATRALHVSAIGHLTNIRPNSFPFPNNLYWATSKKYELKGKIPAARVACAAHGRVDLESGQIMARFAVLPESGMVGKLPAYNIQDGQLVAIEDENPNAAKRWAGQEFDEINVWQPLREDLSRRGLISNSTNLTHEVLFNGVRRVLTVPVSIWNDTGSSVGIAVLHSNSDTETHLTTCSVDARWVKARTIIEAVNDYDFLDHSFVEGKVANTVKTRVAEIEDNYGSQRLKLGPIPTSKEHDGPPTMIRLTPSWFNAFSPVLSTSLGLNQGSQGDGEDRNSQGQTTLERLLQTSSVFEHMIWLRETEITISSAVVDGLSRTGLIPNDESSRFIGPWDGGYDAFLVANEREARKWVRVGMPKEMFSEPTLLTDGDWNTTRIVMRARYNGYAMHITSWFDGLCVGLLLAHVLIAIAHTVWIVWHRETSGAWGSVLELVALAAKSPPPEEGVLENTSAGVDSFTTVGSVAWVESHAQVRLERLRLRFKGDRAGRDKRLMPVVEQKYDRVVMGDVATPMSEGVVLDQKVVRTQFHAVKR